MLTNMDPVDIHQRENRSSKFDIPLFLGLIAELNAARRNLLSYPKNHPFVESSLSKALSTYNRFIRKQGEIIIGVTRNSLLAKGMVLDKNNILFKDFARILFEHGIGALTLRHGLTPSELKRFAEILCLKRAELLERGGIKVEWANAEIMAMGVQPIRYDLFNVVDASSEQNKGNIPQALWESFARSLIQIQGPSSPPHPIKGDDGNAPTIRLEGLSAGKALDNSTGAIKGGDNRAPAIRFFEELPADKALDNSMGDIVITNDEIAPGLLAAIVNRQLGYGETNEEVSVPTSNRSGLMNINEDDAEDTPADELAQEGMTTFWLLSQSVNSDHVDLTEPYKKLALFINGLHPEIRRQFLRSSFDVNSISGGAIAEEIFPNLSLEVIKETLDDISRNRFEVQPSFVGILETLRANAQQQRISPVLKANESLEIQRKIRDIFREQSYEKFVPTAYKYELEKMIPGEQDAGVNQAELSKLLKTIDEDFIENQISDIVIRIIQFDTTSLQSPHLIKSLEEIFYYLLSTGDYSQMCNLIQQCQSEKIPPDTRNRLAQIYSSHDNLYEILVGLTIWGKKKYDYVTRLIRVIGESFIEALLDRLAHEETLSLRRFLMQRIVEFGDKAKAGLLNRLSDKRWFMLRNTIILLRQLDDPTILDSIRPLLTHPHPRVRQETLRTCMYFRDPAAERQILHDMDSSDHETRLSAIYMADKTKSPDVFKKLLAIIRKSLGYTKVDAEYELKKAAISVLKDIGRVEALPELSKLLTSKSFIHPFVLSKLKLEALDSLSCYPPAAVRPILSKIANGSGKVARQARIMLKTLPGKES